MSAPYYADADVTVYRSACLDILRTLVDSSVDAIVTDPPYGIGFMGKEWDSGKSFVERKPVRSNTFDHVGGNHNPTDAADAARTRRAEAVKFGQWCEVWAAECLRVLKPGGYMIAFGGTRTWHRLVCAVEDAGFEIRDTIAWLYGSGFPKSHNLDGDHEGWGTALKPGFEPAMVARKPLAATVAANVATHGTGALHIAACRIGDDPRTNTPGGASSLQRVSRVEQGYRSTITASVGEETTVVGRWPTNVVLDTEAATELDRQSGVLTSGANPTRRSSDKFRDVYHDFKGQTECTPARGADTGGASRFFPTFRYEAKAPTSERPNVDGVTHPTVKPLELMRWLVRLVTPVGGLVLDPFAGSGTTAEACVIEGFRCIAVEQDAKYLPLITSRLTKPLQTALFVA